jgi:hypothetical protein
VDPISANNNIKHPNFVIQCKPPEYNNQNVGKLNNNPNSGAKILKKKDSDNNKEIVDFIKKNDEKKKNINSKDVNNVVRNNSEKPHRNSNANSEENKNAKIVANINSIQVNANHNPQSENDKNPLTEFLKKKREELKNSNTKEEIVWIGKEKEPEKKAEKMVKFPKIVIVEKQPPVQGRNSDLIEVNAVDDSPDDSISQKHEEEFYNANRYLNELAKIGNDEEEELDEQQNEIHSPEEKNESNEERDFPIDDSVGTQHDTAATDSNYETNTDNSQIEELRIELETSLGLDLFMKVYKIVDEKV